MTNTFCGCPTMVEAIRLLIVSESEEGEPIIGNIVNEMRLSFCPWCRKEIGVKEEES